MAAAALTYCNFGEACWPAQGAWESLNVSVSGNLKKIADVQTVFAECQDSIRAYGGAAVHSAANGTCSLAAPCVFANCDTSSWGSLPVYSIEALSVADVQAGVAFANENNIRVSVLSTGASYSVSNIQRDSLHIWMSHFPKYSAIEGVADATIDSCGTAQGPTLKVGGGEAWGSVFAALAADGRYEVSSGAAVEVGGAGGWLQGGGLGPFDRSLGLGIDNVVQYEVVTADGTFHTIDACAEPDLFWALRGGGGGNWGVVTSATYKVHVKTPMVRIKIGWLGDSRFTGSDPVGATVNIPSESGGAFTAVKSADWGVCAPGAACGDHPTMTRWHDAILSFFSPATMDDRLDGYMGPSCYWQEGGSWCAIYYWRGTMAELETALLAQLRATLEITDVSGGDAYGDMFYYTAHEYGSYYDFASASCPGSIPAQTYACSTLGYPSSNGVMTSDASADSAVEYGTNVVWLVPSRYFDGSDDAAARAMLSHPLMWYGLGHIVGGAVSRVAGDATAIHPAIRTSAMHFQFTTAFHNDTTASNIREIIGQYFPPTESAPCFNHDGLNLAVYEPLGASYGMTWQDLYWGSNLERLRGIKAAYDPNGTFTCRDCITANDVPPTCPTGCAPTGRHSWRRDRKLLFGSFPTTAPAGPVTPVAPCPMGCAPSAVGFCDPGTPCGTAGPCFEEPCASAWTGPDAIEACNPCAGHEACTVCYPGAVAPSQ